MALQWSARNDHPLLPRVAHIAQIQLEELRQDRRHGWGFTKRPCDDESEPPKRPGNYLQGPAQFRADLDLVRDQFPAGVFRAGGQGGRPGWAFRKPTDRWRTPA